MLSDIPVVILAGGLGTRLRPVLTDRPKALAPIGDQSFLQIQMELLRDQGARRFVLCVGYRAAQIWEELGDGRRLGVRVDYSVEGKRLLGTGGALKLAERFFEPRALVLNGDTYLAADYEALVRSHDTERHRSEITATIAVAHADDASEFGTVLLDPAQKRVVGFREKDSRNDGISGWLNAGAYVIERSLLRELPASEPISLERQVFPEALAKGKSIAALPCAANFYDIGTPASLHRFLTFHEHTRLARPSAA